MVIFALDRAFNCETLLMNASKCTLQQNRNRQVQYHSFFFAHQTVHVMFSWTKKPLNACATTLHSGHILSESKSGVCRICFTCGLSLILKSFTPKTLRFCHKAIRHPLQFPLNHTSYIFVHPHYVLPVDLETIHLFPATCQTKGCSHMI